MYISRATFDTLRSALFSSITTSYTAVGTPLPFPAAMLIIKNGTNGDVLISMDGVNNYLGFPADSITIYNLETNKSFNSDLFLAEGTQFYVKQGAAAPSSGSFYIEAVLVVPTGKGV